MEPDLRFSEFTQNWEKKDLSELTDKITVGIATEVSPYISSSEEVPILRNQNIKSGFFDNSDIEYITSAFDIKNKNKRVQSGDILIVRTGSNVGNACVVPEQYTGSQTFTTLIVRPTEELLISQFLSFHINHYGLSEVRRLAAGGAKPNLNAGFLKSYRIWSPKIKEQRKIASFLSAVDKKIQQLQKKKDLLEQYKKGVMQKLFSQEIRLKQEDGSDFPDWEERKLKTLTRKISNKNKEHLDLPVYSVNNKVGFIPQGDQFEGMDSTSRGFDTSMYKIVEQNMFAYNPARINVGSCGFSYDLEQVLISSLYVCFKTTQELEDQYLLNYMETYEFNKAVLRNVEGGVRDYLFYDNFSNIKIPLPSISEQNRICEFINSINQKNERQSAAVEKAKQFKKGLLQQMFV